MPGLWKLTFVELKLQSRDIAGIAFPIIIPLFVLIIFGLSFDAQDTSLPAMSVAIALALNALYTVPTVLGTYRENGVLRRLSTTPVQPATLLVAQLLIHLFLTVVSVVILISVSAVVLGITLPRHLSGTLLTFTLGIVAMFAIGCVVAALAPNARTASGVGVVLYFPLAFLGGVTIPREQMPALLARIGDWTPLGAFRQALQDSWQGTTPQPFQLGIMTLCALLAGLIAVRCFRWD